MNNYSKEEIDSAAKIYQESTNELLLELMKKNHPEFMNIVNPNNHMSPNKDEG